MTINFDNPKNGDYFKLIITGLLLFVLSFFAASKSMAQDSRLSSHENNILNVIWELDTHYDIDSIMVDSLECMSIDQLIDRGLYSTVRYFAEETLGKQNIICKVYCMREKRWIEVIINCN